MPKIILTLLVIGLIVFVGARVISPKIIKSTKVFPTPSIAPIVSPIPTPVEITPTLVPTPTIVPSPVATPTVVPVVVPAVTSPTPVVSGLVQMPGDGYHSGTVKTADGNFSLTCVGGNRRSMRVVTDSASENDCKNDCPVMGVADYASRNNGFAAMNGMYFCPADYPSCADKKNSFDTLFFNSRVKRYLNSDNNVYSVIPFFVVLNGGDTRFMGKTLEWGRDTNIQAGIAGNPMLVAGGRNVVGEYSIDDKQRNGLGPKGAVVRKGDLLYLCVVSSATVPQTAGVYTTLGADEAMNIDGGGSAAMWVNGRYIFGPGRNLPNAIIFAH